MFKNSSLQGRYAMTHLSVNKNKLFVSLTCENFRRMEMKIISRFSQGIYSKVHLQLQEMKGLRTPLCKYLSPESSHIAYEFLQILPKYPPFYLGDLSNKLWLPSRRQGYSNGSQSGEKNAHAEL